MTNLEERLSRELKELSERAQPGSIRPLREPPIRRRSRAVRWLAPAAAVVAVIGVIAGASLAGLSVGRRPASPGPGGQMPPYYVSLAANYRQNKIAATVRDSTTGMALTTVRVPWLASAGLDITAAGDDRTFVITELPIPSISEAGKPGSQNLRFYRLLVAPGGRSASLSKLPIGVSLNLSGDAVLSPDGSMVAISVQYCRTGNCQKSAIVSVGIRVITLATGAARTWTTSVPHAPIGLSWDGNGQILFGWDGRFRLLSITGASRNLLSSRVVAPAAVAETAWAFVTPDGTAIITPTAQGFPDGHGRDTIVSKIVELSLATGRPLRILHTASVSIATSNPVAGTGTLGDDCQVFALGPAGVHALVDCVGFGATGFGRLDGTRFTPLPGVPSLTATTGLSGGWGTGDW